MKQLYIIALFFSIGNLCAQETQIISTGQGYNFQDYINLTDGTDQQVANTGWDIAFSVEDGEAGIFINESVNSSPTAFPIQAYATFSDDFSHFPDSSFFLDYPLWNRETSWSYGALNEYREPGDPDDFGWGMFNSNTDEIDGIFVYAIQLRDGSFLKLQIQSLINGVYTFRYAEFDGSNEVTKTIDKADHGGNILAYYSFNSGETVDVEPAEGYDLLFCRYIALLDAGGDSVAYPVTGILSAKGIEVAQADNVDPETVEFEPYRDSLSSHPEIIGHDWKMFDLGNFEWVINSNLAFFLKTRDAHIWKIVLTDFGGSGNGNTTIEKTDLGILSAVDDPSSHLSAFKIFPNPSPDEINVAYTLKDPTLGDVSLQLFDSHGRFVEQREIHSGEGLNVITLDGSHLQSGLYYLRMVVGLETYAEALQIIR